jgi:hypothetical protein
MTVRDDPRSRCRTEFAPSRPELHHSGRTAPCPPGVTLTPSTSVRSGTRATSLLGSTPAKVEKAVADARLPGPCRERLLDEVAALRKENQELWDAYLQAIDLPQSSLQFTTCAGAMGLSQILLLLAVLLSPSRLPCHDPWALLQLDAQLEQLLSS